MHLMKSKFFLTVLNTRFHTYALHYGKILLLVQKVASSRLAYELMFLICWKVLHKMGILLQSDTLYICQAALRSITQSLVTKIDFPCIRSGRRFHYSDRLFWQIYDLAYPNVKKNVVATCVRVACLKQRTIMNGGHVGFELATLILILGSFSALQACEVSFNVYYHTVCQLLWTGNAL